MAQGTNPVDDNIKKELYRNKIQVLTTALRGMGVDGYIEDMDEEGGKIFIEKWEGGTYKTYKTSYSFDNNFLSATISKDFVEVVRKDVYEDAPVTKSFLTEALDKLVKSFGGTTRESEPVEQSVVVKQFDEDQMIEIAKMYISPEEIDAHDDSMTAEEIVKMVANFNSANEAGVIKGNIDHKTNTEQFSFVKAWVSECDCTIGGHFVPEGTPLLKIKYNDKELWKERKAGGYTGWSIGAKAKGFEYVEVE